MYQCIEDYHKLVVCYILPKQLAEGILSMIEQEMQKDARVRKNALLKELVNNEQYIYNKLTHELFDKYANSHEIIEQMSNSMERLPHDCSWYYLGCLSFDVKVYHIEETEEERWKYYLRMVLGSTAKTARIVAMKLVITT